MEVTSFSKSGEHEIRNRKEENNMDENTKKRLDQQFAFIREIFPQWDNLNLYPAVNLRAQE